MEDLLSGHTLRNSGSSINHQKSPYGAADAASPRAIPTGDDYNAAEGMSPRSVRSAGGASSAAEEVVSSLSTSLKLSEIRTRPAEKDLESARRGPLTVYAATWNLNGKVCASQLRTFRSNWFP